MNTFLSKRFVTPALATFLFTLGQGQAWAGKITYSPITRDDDSGIAPAVVFTSAAAAGAEHEVAGVKLFPLAVSGRSAQANDVTVTATSGSIELGPGAQIEAEGAIRDVFSQAILNNGADDESQEEIVLDPGGLKAGQSYHLRIYIASLGEAPREIGIAFAGDGKLAATGRFDEDDATTSPGHFPTRNQPYYIDYAFTWDGKTTPGAIVTQKNGDAPFALFAVTNIEGGTAAVAARRVARSEPVATRSSRPRAAVQSEQFYSDEALNRHGQWVQAGQYGTVWHPTDVEPDWRPYTRGRWVYSDDDGWTWDSDEDFGWATCHYGRWAQVQDAGWCWAPGAEWAPSWVSWRSGGDYCGWAPLPPTVDVSFGYGGRYSSDYPRSDLVGNWVDARYDIGPGAYSFLRVADLGAEGVRPLLFAQERNVEIYQNTTNITNIVRNSRSVYVGGPNFQQVNAATTTAGTRAVPRVALRLRSAGPAGTAKGGALQNGVLTMRAPAITNEKKVELPKIAQTIKSPALDTGWKGVPPQLHKTLAATAAPKRQTANEGGAPAGTSTSPEASSPATALHVGAPITAKGSKRGGAPGAAAPLQAAAPLHVGQKIGRVSAPKAPRVEAEAGHTVPSAPAEHLKQGGKYGVQKPSATTPEPSAPLSEGAAAKSGKADREPTPRKESAKGLATETPIAPKEKAATVSSESAAVASGKKPGSKHRSPPTESATSAKAEAANQKPKPTHQAEAAPRSEARPKAIAHAPVEPQHSAPKTERPKPEYHAPAPHPQAAERPPAPRPQVQPRVAAPAPAAKVAAPASKGSAAVQKGKKDEEKK